MDSLYGANYRRLYQRHWWWCAREEAILSALRHGSWGNGHEQILDVGCGDGLLFDRLREFGEVEGVEIDGALVSKDGPWRDRIHVGPFDDSFRPKRRYSLILMLDVLEHLPHPVAALRHARDLLADRGMLLITVPALPALWTSHDDLNHHYVRYTKGSFQAVADEAAVKVRRLQYLFHWTCPVKLAIRFKEAFLVSRPAPPRVPLLPINWALYQLSRLEQVLARRLPLPFGSSLMAVAGR